MTSRDSERGLPSAGYAGAIRGGGREERAVRRATTVGRGAKPPSEDGEAPLRGVL
jgi:hypothetical protein